MSEIAEQFIDDGRIESIQEYLTPEELYADLISRVKKYHPSSNISLIAKAYHIAQTAHRNQHRKSGEPYIIHPLYVAIILADLRLDKETICAGLLHDVVEDTIMTEEEIEKHFGEEVAHLVDGVTKLQNIHLVDGEKVDKLEQQAENLRKMFLAMAKDIRVIMIKLADRLHNMRTLKHMPEEKQKRIARETLDIYSPIAQRLGISRIKVEIDDLSFMYLEPEAYADLEKHLSERQQGRENYIRQLVGEIRTGINDANIDALLDGRVKHYYSIYRKMKNQGKTIDQIYDLFAVRIRVNDIRDCYSVLGIVHEMYTPIPERFKDYIAIPKANMYQSLHTTVVGGDGQPFEVQIRTHEMHMTAEYGIAAHWKYKENPVESRIPFKNLQNTNNDENNIVFDEPASDLAQQKLDWLRQILEWQKDMSDNKEFISGLTKDLDSLTESIYCFTPDGEVKDLPAGSTPIDFAYAIHSAIGNKMIGARVDGKLAAIDYQIKNGDRVEIITSNNSKGPSRDWINIAKSNNTKNKINQWFKNEFKDENIQKGKEIFLSYCKARNFDTNQLLQNKYTDTVTRKYGFKTWDSVLAAIGHGGLKEGQVVNRVKDMYDEEHKSVPTNEEILHSLNDSKNNRGILEKVKGGIAVKGVDDVAVRFSKCCSPVPGDEIVGFITRGRGVSIHRTDCVNIVGLAATDRMRLIEAEWELEDDTPGGGRYLAEILVYADSREGLIADVTKTMSEQGIIITSMNVRTSKKGVVTMSSSFEVSGKEELDNMISRLKCVKDVREVERMKG